MPAYVEFLRLLHVGGHLCFIDTEAEGQMFGFIVGVIVLYLCLVVLVAPVVAQRLRGNFEDE